LCRTWEYGNGGLKGLDQPSSGRFTSPRQPPLAPFASTSSLKRSSSHPVSREWALICEAPGHGACLVAWEPPGRSAPGDPEREFECLMSVEPAVVREAAETAATLAAPLAPDLAEQARDYMEQLAPPRVETQLRLSSSITARLLASLRESLNSGGKGNPKP